MSEYGCNSLTESFNNDKERIIKALEGELLAGENENGFIYEKASAADCKQYILEAFDNAVFHALRGYASGKALEEIIKERGKDVGIYEYMNAISLVEREREKTYGKYNYTEAGDYGA